MLGLPKGNTKPHNQTTQLHSVTPLLTYTSDKGGKQYEIFYRHRKPGRDCRDVSLWDCGRGYHQSVHHRKGGEGLKGNPDPDLQHGGWPNQRGSAGTGCRNHD